MTRHQVALGVLSVAIYIGTACLIFLVLITYRWLRYQWRRFLAITAYERELEANRLRIARHRVRRIDQRIARRIEK